MGELVHVSTGSRNTQDGCLNGAYPFFIRSEQVSSLNEYDYDETAILIPGDGRIGEIFHLYSGKYALHQRVYRLTNFQKIRVHYLYSLLQARFRIHALRMNAQGTVPSLRKPVFDQWGIEVPALAEQVHIGEFFRVLDELIAAAKRKADLLKQKKRHYLQAIFTQRLRFQGYDQPWQQHKLGDILDERSELQSPDDNIPLVSFTVEAGVTPKTERYDRSFLVRDGMKLYKRTNFNDIVYNPANLKFGAIARNTFGSAVFSPIYVTFTTRDIVMPEFMELLVCNSRFVRMSLKYQEGTVYERMSVKPEDFLRLKVHLPTKDEQTHISSFFRVLDSLISESSRKVELLHQLKAAYLQQMFV